MGSFDEREKGYENKYARDQELLFKARARRNKRLGLWAAELIGLSGELAESYARDVVMADLEGSGEDDVLKKLARDFAAQKVHVSEKEIRQHMHDLMQAVRAEMEIGAGNA